MGGVPTETVAWATNDVFIQMWIGAEDKLPRRIRAMFATDPLKLRHEMELSNWQIEVNHAADTFASQKAQSAQRIAFEARRRHRRRAPRPRRRQRNLPRLRRPNATRRHLEEFTMKRTRTRLALALVGPLVAGPALGLGQRQPLRRQHHAQLRVDQSHTNA